jgi:hypothetical protein
MSSLYKNNGTYYLSVSKYGKRITRSLSTDNENIALEVKPTVELDLLKSIEFDGVGKKTKNAIKHHKWKNTSTKGYVGQNLTEIDLLKRGYAVYRPIVDDDGVDMIVEVKSYNSDYSRFVTLQVKYSETFDSYSSIHLDVRGSRADWIALVTEIEGNMTVLYLKNKDRTKRWGMNIRITDAKNNQQKGVNQWYKYKDPRF